MNHLLIALVMALAVTGPALIVSGIPWVALVILLCSLRVINWKTGRIILIATGVFAILGIVIVAGILSLAGF
jgi:hypothetical protein